MNLIVSGQWFPEYSGVGNRIEKTYNELDIEYCVISGIWNNDKIEYNNFKCRYIKKYNLNMNNNIKNKIIKKMLYLVNLFITFFKVPFELKKIKNKFKNIDTIHTLRGGGFLYFYVVFWAEYIFKDFNLVVENAGGDGYDQLVHTGKSALGLNMLSFIGVYIFTYVIKKADYIIYASEHLKSPSFKTKAKEFIRNAYYDSNIFHPVNNNEKLKLKEKYSISQNKKIFLTIGMVDTLKNQQFIANILNEINFDNWIWLVVGTSNDNMEYVSELKSLIGDKMIYIYKWNDKAYEYYQLSDFYLFASTREGNNNTINEALMCGLPVVILENECYSHLHKFKDVYKESISLCNNQEEFKLSIETILQSEVIANKIYKVALKLYSKDKYYGIYKKVLGIR